MPKRILIIDGHTTEHSLCNALAERYQSGAKAGGHDVQLIRLRDLNFDPILRGNFQSSQVLEPDLQKAQAAIAWAEHITFVYPIWWGGLPALLKGFIDRTFLPHFAFKYRKDSPFPEQLLKGKSADLLVTMDTPPWYYRWIYGNPAHNQMRKTILQFCGIRPVRVHSFGSVKQSSEQHRAQWMKHAYELGQMT